MAGQYIKTSTRGENARIEYATSCMQGPRDEMQDYYTALLDLDGSDSTSFFGVFDGHGGHRVAWYCSRKFHTELVKVPDYQNNLHAALEHVCFRIDEALKRSDEWKRPDSPPAPAPAPGNGSFRSRLQTSLCSCFGKNYEGPQIEGSTACVALIRGNQIIVGNVGDSRCVLSRNGQAIDLSTDHKPNEPGERARIEAAGGSLVQRQVLVYASGRMRVVQGPYRVDGIIAVSRALGDFQFKKNNKLKLICNPDIHTEDITDDIDFLLIASDGIWEVKTSEEVVTYVNERLQTRADLHVICEGLLEWCRDSRDNSTVILVQFKNGNNPTANASCSGDSCPQLFRRPRPQAKTADPSSSIGAPKVDTKAEIKAAEE